MKNTLPILASSDVCTGCAACANICPYDCIAMQPTQEGFLEPEVDPALCPLVTKGKCGICEDICPVLHPKYLNNKPDCYAIQANDEERKQSSSGAFIPIVAKYILSRPEGGFVYGAAWTGDLTVEHTEVSNEAELSKIRLSKYVQSNPKLIYRQVKRRLKEDKWVLFTGTPCEVAGLYSTLGKTSTEKLVTIDLVCHGVPSNKVLKKFLLDSGYRLEDIKEFRFRDKSQGWVTRNSIFLTDGRVIPNNRFMDAFNPCLIQRKSCGVCPFAKLPRQGDLSCGDFWGVEKFHKEVDNKGTSFVLVNSYKGQKIFSELTIRFPFVKRIPIEEPLHINKTIEHPFRNHSGRKHFYSSIDIKPFNKLVEDSLNHHYDVGIVGPWFGINYGSILTYFALYVLVRDLGFDAVMLPRPDKLWQSSAQTFDAHNSIAQKFVWKYCNVFKTPEPLKIFPRFNESCKMFVLGSDVVWSYAVCGRNVPYFYFLDWVSADKKKIAFAPSIGKNRFGDGVDRSFLESYKSYVSTLLKRFSAISVRETSAVRVISDLSQRTDVVQVLDPVFIVDKQVYLNLLPKNSQEEAHVFAYILSPNLASLKKMLLKQVADYLKIENVYLCPNAINPWPVRKAFSEYNCAVIDVEDWIHKLSSAAFFVGDTFHGLCFSLVFHIPFLIVFNEKFADIERFRSLLKIVGLEERLISKPVPQTNVENLIRKPINWEMVEQRLAGKREFSRKWLKDQLTKENKEVDPEIIRLENMVNSLMDRLYGVEPQKLELRGTEEGHIYTFIKKHRNRIPRAVIEKLMWLKPYITRL